MPRKPRLISPGTIYHVTVRGNNQQKIFKSIADRLKYLSILKKLKEKYKFKCFAFCLMPNHVHLLIIPSKIGSISEILHDLNLAYSKYFRRKHRYSGHLYQDRFYSTLINSERYLWIVSRYIHLNPVKAGLCQKPEDYQWSSYRIYFKQEFQDNLIDKKELLDTYFPGKGWKEEEKVEAYKKFVEEGLALKEEEYQRVAKELKLTD